MNMDFDRRITVVSALLSAAIEIEFHSLGLDRLEELALQYGKGQDVTEVEIMEMLTLPLQQILDGGL